MYRVTCRFCADCCIYNNRADFASTRCPACGSAAAACRSYEWLRMSEVAAAIGSGVRVDSRTQQLETKHENS